MAHLDFPKTENRKPEIYISLQIIGENAPRRLAAERYASVATTKKSVGNNVIENLKFRKSLTESCAEKN